MIYAVTGDFEQALAMNTESLAVTHAADDKLQEMGALNQAANLFLERGELPRALELATQAWELAQKLGINDARADASDTLGQVLQAMGEYERAEQLLAETLEIDRQTENEWGQVNCLLALGKVRISLQKFAQAQADLQKSLKIAKKIGSHQLQIECHAQLSQIFEQQGRWKQALAHCKAYHKMYIESHNETTSKKLAALKVAHQVETAKRDAEIYHLRNEELLHEIEERKKAEQTLEEMAMTDPLTDLFNRRHFFRVAEFILNEAVRYEHALSVMILDIDNFKQVNDTYGHATGDEAIKLLAATIKSIIRTADVAARFGGDEFVVLMPETNSQQALKTAQRLRLYLAERTVPTNQYRFHFTLSIGVASVSAEVNSIDILLEHADRALYLAKQTGRNQIQVYQKP
jgi:diguanylate cyclase (GGDEF)-like protein